ncbi:MULTISPECIES: cytochrome c [unclassified Bradyrhizobium]|uniref:c-type cytochrome n=1 Tax=unclassified Bradyrhizobium TaxID=2631580 RepID=UPI001FF8535C|nr:MULTISPECIES: cytochrome c [unclassified Bradyrhizobium]MCK1321733.1 cytochrome c [Bradyrhizobium sp. 156]MCK1524386.1 cytochrome c [Bradyrhizobium sp. 17]MCK1539715.1 cytochrome c [Bradyrhizobium sp. 176]MCK1561343.1 cytochrome c [Bradyrhizobium sp. 171]MCK1632449.1 cytochrome c [Bradyrhizobium sp. 162]
MLRRTIPVALLAALAAAGVYWWLSAPVGAAAGTAPARVPDLANGQVMFNAGGCASCHAVPDQPDRLRLGGGVAIKSPFGTFYAPNISSDPTDGIGKWSEAEFVNAVMHGVSPDGQHYFPAFPYTSYQHARREDVLDLFAYLKTLPAVAGKVRDHDVPFPFNIRRNVGIWKFLFLDDKPFVPDSAKSPQWNRGAYLVDSFGHCAECHSPRNALGGITAAQRFAGGPNPEGEGWVPNITQKGLGEWSAKDIAYFLKTGELPDGDSVGGAMTRVIKNTSQLPDDDLAAMADYLKSLPPVDGPPRPKRKEGGT